MKKSRIKNVPHISVSIPDLSDIDTIPGATVSSKCILKAIKNAIEHSEKGDLNR